MKREIAIGDIHGRFDLLERLWKVINFNAFYDTIIFVGDYIDRGLNSKEVVEFILDLVENYPDNIILLKGNHEHMAETYFVDLSSEFFDVWERNGGQNTITSFGDLKNTGDALKELFPHLKLYHINEEEKIFTRERK